MRAASGMRRSRPWPRSTGAACPNAGGSPKTLAPDRGPAYMALNSGAPVSTPGAPPADYRRAARPFFCFQDCPTTMSDLIAKTAIDKRLAQIVEPVAADMGLEL